MRDPPAAANSRARNSPPLMAAVVTCPFPQPTLLLHLPSSSRRRSSNPLLENPKHPPSKILCGPRNNRQPLRRGRTLSTESILTIQALKRARGDSAVVDRIVSTSAARLIKADLLAALAELQRQDHWRIALKVFASARRENWYTTDCALYADMVAALARSGANSEIDLLAEDLIGELERRGGIAAGDLRGPVRVVKALVSAGKGKAAKDLYDMMKRGGCEPNEYLFKFLIKGLRRLGEADAVSEIENDYELWGKTFSYLLESKHILSFPSVELQRFCQRINM